MIWLKNLSHECIGATSIEYALIASLVAIAALAAVQSLGSKLGQTFGNVSMLL